jgi:hypothetical protein
LAAEKGLFTPSSGALVASIAVGSGRPVDLLGLNTCYLPVSFATDYIMSRAVGKPSLHFLDILRATHNINPSRTCMVGDRLDTDMAFAAAGDLQVRVSSKNSSTYPPARMVVELAGSLRCGNACVPGPFRHRTNACGRCRHCCFPLAGRQRRSKLGG